MREEATSVFWTPILYDVAHALESVEDPEIRLDRVVALLRRFVPYDRCALLEATPVLGDPLSVWPEAPAEERDALADRLGHLFELVCERPVPEMREVTLPRAPGRVHLAVPIIGMGEATGIVFVERAAAPYEQAHLAFLSVVAAQISAYLAAVSAARERDRLDAEQTRLLEERGRDLSLMEMFLGMLSHDLRNPLNAIRMSAEYLHNTGGARLPTMTARVLASTDRMKRMVDELLDLTRIRLAGGIPLEPHQVDLSEVCSRGIDELQAAYPDASIELEVAGDARGEWDSDRLLQLVSNLGSNAIQHLEGAPGITLRVTGTERAVELAIHNAGTIPTDLTPFLFDPFRSVQVSGDRERLGLGLFISKHIVEAHGGSIEVQSSASEGTTFTVRLPRR